MEISKTVSGFCPTLNEEYSVEVCYKLVNNRYVQVGADCNYLSYDFNRCQIYKECPLRAKAPKELNND